MLCIRTFVLSIRCLYLQNSKSLHSEKSLARSMLFYSRNCRQQNWTQFVLYINSDCVYIGDLWLQLWLKNCCKNTGYCSIFQLSLLLLLNKYQYKCNNTISSVSLLIKILQPLSVPEHNIITPSKNISMGRPFNNVGGGLRKTWSATYKQIQPPFEHTKRTTSPLECIKIINPPNLYFIYQNSFVFQVK